MFRHLAPLYHWLRWEGITLRLTAGVLLPPAPTSRKAGQGWQASSVPDTPPNSRFTWSLRALPYRQIRILFGGEAGHVRITYIWNPGVCQAHP
jgi:hypothetical protein